MHTSVWRLQRGKHQAGCNPPPPKKKRGLHPHMVRGEGRQKNRQSPESRRRAKKSPGPLIGSAGGQIFSRSGGGLLMQTTGRASHSPILLQHGPWQGGPDATIHCAAR